MVSLAASRPASLLRAGYRRWLTLWRTDRRTLLHEQILAVIGAGFLLSPEPVWSDFFYVLVLPLALSLAWRARAGLDLRRMSPVLLAGSVLILWLATTLLWDPPTLAQPGKLALWLWNVFCTLIYIHALADALETDATFRPRITRVMALAGLANMAISFARLGLHPAMAWAGDVLRMNGWAETRHPIMGAIVIGIVVLMALDRALRVGGWYYWLAALAGLVFIVLTGSRGPEGAICVSASVLLGLTRPRLILVIGLATLLALGLFACLDWPLLHHLVAGHVARGDSHRLAIWARSWHDICQKPWFGHGPGYLLAGPHSESFPHNLLLSTWLYGGIIGVGLLGLYAVLVTRRALGTANRADRALNVALLVQVGLSAMTDFSQVIKGPSLMWYIFWLPTLFAASAAQTREHTRDQA
ncbi:O-antigen ligase family protein [Acetobacter sp. TBRC 12305]|uniref:O-antigen ligase family protein n=1 Tax=Acetobacter garciniae TaxID=2817435 RepID=A0A939KMD0_9PROT|nr:O-antigen ligase family protein [Acetobacter garciniae]MBO1325193.1 O-antigen ligase family protein [Acetobacter garciniae]MBX0344836.1 O-antigen ligase family protein [Acetobacter garciniae]